MADPRETNDLLELTTEIVSSHLANNPVAIQDIPDLIRQVYGTLTTIDQGPSGQADRPQPAVPIKRSVTPDHIICLEDGRKLKMLKRHLKTSYNMTPVEYRERWGLPADYPMVAPNYARQRSNLAKKIGLGRKPRRRG